ncbi:hypothetical protein [Roseateles sp. MS654]|uniref:hypothetical protein n=1 Tax=Roseateles sp. MS654 TaxID=3412685 RepID=UPI003C2C6A8E
MTDDGFWADVEVEPVGEALFRAMLVLGLSRSSEGEDPIRIPLAGEHPTAEDARAAARSAIKVMAEGRH